MRTPFVFLVSFILVLSVISISFIPPDIKMVSADSQWTTEKYVINVSYMNTLGQGSYASVHDNCVVTTPNGTILAFVCGRQGGTTDFYQSDIYIIRSYDGGITWQPGDIFIDSIPDASVVNGYGVDNGADDISCKVGCADTIGDRVYLFFAGFPSGGSVSTTYVSNFFMYSDTNGSTWSDYYNLTTDLTLWSLDNYVFVGSGNSQGTYMSTGRYVIAGWHSTTTLFAVWSDNITMGFDAGWSRTGNIGSGSEWGIVECENGSLYGNIRYTSAGYRYETYSNDNGSTWSTPSHPSNLLDPKAKGSIIEFTDTVSYNTSRVVLAWNNNTGSRVSLTLAIGTDNCTEWGYSRQIVATAQYPDLCITSNMSILCIWLPSTTSQYMKCSIANLEWVSNGADSLDPIGGDPGGEYNPSVINEMGYSGNYSLGNESVMVGDFYINWTWDTNGTPSYHWINISNSSGFSTLYKNFNVSHAGVVEGSYCNYTITIVTASTTKRYIHIRSFYE